MGELELGVLVAQDQETRSRRADTLNLARRLAPVPINEWVMGEWARLVDACRSSGVASRAKGRDSLIAATAITLGVPDITRDDDFDVMARAHPVLAVLKI